MTLKVGAIGTGMTGHDHIRRLTTVVSGADFCEQPLATTKEA